jgi:GYF domain 2
MSQLWHYTRDGQQRGPVTADELRQLAEAGELEAADLVWTQGMAGWATLGSVEELRPRRADACAITAAAPRPLPAAFPAFELERPTAVAEPEASPVFDEAVSERRRASAAAWQNRVPVALIAGAVSLISFVLAFVLMRQPSNRLEGSYNWSLTTNRHQIWEMEFLEGHRVWLTVRSDGVSDMDLFVYLGDTLVGRDEDLNSDCQVSFLVRKTATYRVKVWNRLLIPDPHHRNGPNNGVLTYRQVDETGSRKQAKANDEPKAPPKDEEAAQQVAQEAPKAPAPPPKNIFQQRNDEAPAVEQPVPKRIMPLPPKVPFPMLPGQQAAVRAAPVVELTINDDLPRKAGSKNVHYVDLQANARYIIDLESDAFDTVLQLNNRTGRKLAFNDDIGNGNRNSRILFQPTEAATYQLVVRAFGSGDGPYRITISRIPD